MQQNSETVIIVDEQNREVAEISRHLMRKGCLIHRACFILVFNPLGELFVQRRTLSKDVYPGYLDVAAGGVVLAGESYEESARRELAEELGLKRSKLKCHGNFYHETEGNRVWGRVYSCLDAGPFILQPEEVAAGFFAGPQKLKVLARREKFTPDGLEALRMVKGGVAFF